MFQNLSKTLFHKRAFQILSLLVIISIVTSMLSVMMVSADKTEVADEYVIAVPKEATYKWFGQQVSLTPGKTYIFTYNYSRGDNSNPFVYKDLNEKPEAGVPGLKREEDTETFKKIATFTPPADALDGQNGNKLVYVGLRTGEAQKDMIYYYDFKLVDKDNPTENLFSDAGWSEGGSNINKSKWISAYGDAIDYRFTKTTLSKIGGKDTFNRTDDDKNVIAVPKEAVDMWFGQQVSLVPGKTYVFTYNYSNQDNSYPCIYKNLSETGVSGVIREEDDEAFKKIVTFTVPADALDGVNGNKLVYVGLRTGIARKDITYYYDFKLVDKENPTQNLFSDAGWFEGGSNINKSKWISAWGDQISNSFSKTTLKGAGGKDIFKKTDEYRNVIGVAKNAQYMWFGQQVSLKPGKTYVFTYNYTKEDNSGPCIYKNLSEIDVPGVVREEDSESFKKIATFTVPADALDGENGNKLIYVGFRTGGARKDTAYYYDFKLADKENPTQNLFRDPIWRDNGTGINTDIWKSAWGDHINSSFSKTTLNKIGGKDIFKRTESDKKVIALTSPDYGSLWFGQQVALAPNKEYEFSYYNSPKDNGIPTIYKNLVETSFSITEKVKDPEYCKTTVKFTPPADALTDANGNKLIWVGIRSGDKSSDPLYYYDFKLIEKENPTQNLFSDGAWLDNGSEINKSKWISAWGDQINYAFWKTTLGEIGGIEVFKRPYKLNNDPKMLYYDRTGRGPGREAYGCFTLAFPESVQKTGKNYVFEFSARAGVGGVLDQFRMYSLDPALYVDNEFSVKPSKIDGYRYSFNLRQDMNSTEGFTFMIFVPEGSKGHISYLSMYEADANFNKINNVDLLKGYYDDFSHYDKLGTKVGMYSIAGACQGTETGRLDEMPQYYFDPSPDVEIPAGSKMVSYASNWGPGQVKIALPYNIESGNANGKNYVVSFYLRPTKGRDPSKYYAMGLRGDQVQIYPVAVEGYKYIFFMKEIYDFKIILDIPQGCEGYISKLEMYEADDDFKAINKNNLATSFGKNGDFSNWTVQYGMSLPGITFTNGFTNTFVDTRKFKEQLKSGIPGDFHSSGALSLIPQGYFDTPDDTGWANEYMAAGAKETGTVKGDLLSEKNTVLSGKQITLISMSDSAVFWTAVTDIHGKFKFDKIPVGGYEIAVTAMDNSLIYGDEYVWIDDSEDIVTVSLKYEGDTLKTLALTGDRSDVSLTILVVITSLSIFVLTILYKGSRKSVR